MLSIISLGCFLIILTGIVHTILTGAVASYLHSKSHIKRSILRAVLRVDVVVLLTITAAIIEAAIWAGVYVEVGALDNFEESLYFSLITYTTLGYGDIVLGDEWRLLASFQAANGVLPHSPSSSPSVLLSYLVLAFCFCFFNVIHSFR